MGKKAVASSSSSKPKAVEDTSPSTSKPQSQQQRSNPRAKIVRSGNAGNSAGSASKEAIVPDDGRPPPLFPVGYKTPLSLLNERCQKNGWQKPDVQPFKTPSGWSCAVTLTKVDPKTGAESVPLRVPTDSDSPIRLEKDTALEAKHWGAVYAIHRFASNLQLGMILPPQCRDYWAALQAEKKAGGKKDEWLYAEDPFAAATARANARAARFAAPAPSASGSSTPVHSGPQLPKDTPEVYMSSEMRELVQSTIRTMRQLHPPGEGNKSTPAFLLAPEEKKRIVKQLIALGYREGHIAAALNYMQATSPDSDPLLEGLTPETVQDTILQYLQITLAEDELPVTAHGYVGRTEAGVRITKRHEKHSGLAEAWLVEKICKEAGYPQEATEQAVSDAGGDEVQALDLLARRLVGWTDAWGDEAVLAPDKSSLSELADAKDLKRKREAELEALQSMSGSHYHLMRAGLLDLNIPESPQPLSLRIHLPSLAEDRPAAYPAATDPGQPPIMPIFFICSSDNSVPAYIRLHLVTLLLQRVRDPDRPDWLEILEMGEGGLLYEMAAYLGEIVKGVLRGPPPSSEVLRHLKTSSQSEYTGRSGNNSGAATPARRTGRQGHFKASGDSASLLRDHQALASRSEYQAMLAKRQRLPAWNAREQLVSTIKSNRVVIVSGATGSGKTTQVPAYVLEDAILAGSGGQVDMICTQPRRISAIGVASRVAQERTEKVGDGLVGYAIRGERKASKGCRLLFCTTGILLQRLSRGGDPDLQGVSHIFVDEVHERSLDSDFLLLILRELLERNKRIKLVLMSATADSDRFSAYFGGAPCLEIPGQTHPVQDFYLEDVIAATQYRGTSMRASRKYTDAENDEIRQSFTSQGIESAEAISTLSMLARGEKIDYDLVGATVLYLTSISNASEAILIFVTGVAEIGQTIRAIERALPARSADILPLHANLSSAEQSKVFAKTSRRKIIVSTNVAETSITVDDVVFVVDTGRVKETRFDPENGLQLLVEDWNSAAGARQRRGRAGRTKPGQCWKLYTRWQEKRLPAHAQPEILRTPLASLVLQVKALRGEDNVAAFLRKALDPPEVAAIDEALGTLSRIGALVPRQDPRIAKLTPLGQNLTLLPLDLRLGKMLILASIFGCLDPMLTLVSCLSTRSVFTSPPDQRSEASAARARFSTAKSDLLTDVHAVETALQLREEGGQKALRDFCEENFISFVGLREVQSLRSDYISALRSAGFSVEDANQGIRKGQAVDDNLLKAIIYAGTGKAVRIRLPEVKYEATIGGTTQLDHEAKEVRFFDTDGRVFMHPSSILFSETKLKNGYLTYFNKSVTSKPFLRDATELPLYALLLFGKEPKADPLKGGITLDDGKIRLKAPPRTAVLVNELRRLLDVELASLIDDPASGDEARPVIQTMSVLLKRDGS